MLPLIFKLIWRWNILNFGSQFRSIFRTLSNTQDGGFCKNSERLFVFYNFCLCSSLKPVTTSGKRSISTVWQGFEFSFALIIFGKLFPICLLNSSNVFHHISVLCAVKSTWPYFQHIYLITKMIIVFPNYVFL